VVMIGDIYVAELWLKMNLSECPCWPHTRRSSEA